MGVFNTSWCLFFFPILNYKRISDWTQFIRIERFREPSACHLIKKKTGTVIGRKLKPFTFKLGQIVSEVVSHCMQSVINIMTAS